MNSNKPIDDLFDYLRPDKTCTDGRFYLLLKLHKKEISRGPIVSANVHITETISDFVDYQLRPHITTTSSYIQDTPDYLKKMHS